MFVFFCLLFETKIFYHHPTWDEAQTEIKIAGRNINNLRYADDTTVRAESTEELKSLLMKVKEESEKAGLKLNIQKMKIMASGPITSWQIDGEKCGNRNKFHFNFMAAVTICSDFGDQKVKSVTVSIVSLIYLP